MCIKLDARPCKLNFVLVYAPTAKSTEELTFFYGLLDNVVNNIPKREITMVIGDLNAKVGSTYGPDYNKFLGKHDLGTRNDRGETFIEFCIGNNLAIMNTMFEQHKRLLYTWTSPDGKTLNQIDYIAIQTRWKSSITNVKLTQVLTVEVITNCLWPAFRSI
ncbi:unnamed protein product [Chrysodeixis includens]|uniref:Craniofacial development protein 2-like n=1 Tax=Chrysodeixis includens TaxID=689277 RepID=A0A9P0G0K4_CHRIL|nr:unnamed protein product [Chrysodeixis includens]